MCVKTRYRTTKHKMENVRCHVVCRYFSIASSLPFQVSFTLHPIMCHVTPNSFTSLPPYRPSLPWEPSIMVHLHFYLQSFKYQLFAPSPHDMPKPGQPIFLQFILYWNYSQTFSKVPILYFSQKLYTSTVTYAFLTYLTFTPVSSLLPSSLLRTT